MIAPESTLHLLPWKELIQDIEYLMKMEEERLMANKSYYKNIFYTENPDNLKLRRLYDRLQEDQQRFDFFSELLVRLQKSNAMIILNAIDDCEAQEKMINGKIPDNWQITIKKVQEQVTFYYYPIKIR